MSQFQSKFYCKLNTTINTPNFPFDPKSTEQKLKNTKKIKDSSLPYLLSYPKEVFYNHFIKQFKRYKLEIDDTHILATPPFTKQAIHMDSIPSSIIPCKLNVTLSNENQPFCWYKKIDYNKYGWELSGHRTYLTSPLQDDEEIYRHNVNGVYLINTSYPHRALNNDNEWRFCLSAAIKNKKGKFITLKEAVDIFRDFIV